MNTVGYATSVQGSDHTSAGGRPPMAGAGDMGWGFADSAVICGFNVFDNDPEPMWDMLAAVTGWKIGRDDWVNAIGPRMLAIQRAALLVGGPDAKWDPDKDDDNPPRWYKPLPSGPMKGKTTDKKRVKADKVTYWKSLGWDARGIPTTETLKKVGIPTLESVFRGMRK
jgi:aldehyde:ferredoxin oxidoreductase